MTNRLISNSPPSPTDHSSPASRKETNLHINTKQNTLETNATSSNVFWKDPTSLFSPPLSPLTPAYQDRHISSGTNKKKPQQQQQGSMTWQQTHWDNVDIEKLTLENAKLKRTNRLLKVDREDWLEKRIRPLDQHIRDLTVANVRWQRAAKLLQQDLMDSQQQLEAYKRKQVTQMPWMGCEYQFLVDMVNQLQTQINGQTTCKERNSSARIPTPSEHTPSREAIENTTNSNRKHYIKQHGSPMTTPRHLPCSDKQDDWNELSALVDRIQSLERDLDDTLCQLSEKQQNEDRINAELLTKTQMIQLLEKDYEELNTQVQTLQHKFNQGGPMMDPTPLNNELAFIPNGITRITTIGDDSTTDILFTPDTDDDFDNDLDGEIDKDSFDLEGNSILVTARDVDRCLPGSHTNKGSVSDGCQEDAATFDKRSCDLPSTAAQSPLEDPLTIYRSTSGAITDHTGTLSSSHSTTSTAITNWDHHGKWTMRPPSLITTSSVDKRFSTTSTLFTLDPPSSISLPGAYPTIPDSFDTTEVESMESIDKKGQEETLMISSLIMGHEPFAPFVVLTFLLGLSTKMGIKDDWLIPITLLALCSGYLWTGAFRGIHIKVNF